MKNENKMEISDIVEKSNVGNNRVTEFKQVCPRKWQIQNVEKYKRLPMHSQTHSIVDDSLKLLGNDALIGKTLLDQKVHKNHAERLNRTVIRKLESSSISRIDSRRCYDTLGGSAAGYFEPRDHQEARKLLGFVTLIHSVQPLNAEQTLLECKDFVSQIKKYFGSFNDAALIGVVEVEVISIKEHRRVEQFTKIQANALKQFIDEDGVITHFASSFNAEIPKFSRKLTVFEKLGVNLKSEDINGLAGQFLIHFHGIIKVKHPDDIKKLENHLLKNPIWSQTPHQYKFTHLSTRWNNRYKSIPKNIKHITTYITKGGAMLCKNKKSFKYKIDFPKGMSISYESFLALNDDDKSFNKCVEHSDVMYPIGQPNLSHHEINELALVVDGMMKLNKHRTGYLVSVGKF